MYYSDQRDVKDRVLPKPLSRLSPRLVLLFGLLTVGCTAQSAGLIVTSVPAVTSVAATRVSAPTEVGTTPVAEATLAAAADCDGCCCSDRDRSRNRCC